MTERAWCYWQRVLVLFALCMFIRACYLDQQWFGLAWYIMFWLNVYLYYRWYALYLLDLIMSLGTAHCRNLGYYGKDSVATITLPVFGRRNNG